MSAGLGFSLVVLFLILNRAAYQSFFQDDDFDTMGWIPYVSPQQWISGLFSPLLSPNNFRPVGHAYYLIEDWAGFNFAPYVAVLQLVHIVNSVLVWRIGRKLGLGPYASLAGAGFYLLNFAAMYTFWKPMYSFDLLCTTFCLASILLWAHGRWILSLAAFWLAYKAKELAVMLPLALACYQLWFGRRRDWWKLIPFFALSTSFGLQAMLANKAARGAYQLAFDGKVAMGLAGHYLQRMALVPYAGFALLLLLPLLVRDRRVWWGVASMYFFLIPLAMLPGRVFDCYTYLPLSCLAIAVGAVAGTKRPFAVPVCAALFFTVWAFRDIHTLKADRSDTLTVGRESRDYFRDMVRYAHTHPKPAAILYAGFPLTFHNWGMRGLFQCAFNDLSLDPLYIDDDRARQAMHAPSLMIVFWDHATRKARFLEHRAGQTEPWYVTMNENTPIWLLDEGWYPLEQNYRWTQPHVTAHLWRPEGVRELVLETNVLPQLTAEPREVRASVDGATVGVTKLDTPGMQTLRWPLKPGAAAMVNVEFDVSKGFKNPGDERVFGLPVVSFGFR